MRKMLTLIEFDTSDMLLPVSAKRCVAEALKLTVHIANVNLTELYSEFPVASILLFRQELLLS